MNERQKTFCIEYLKDFNATRAYRTAYEKDTPLKNAKASAYKLLRKEDVRSYIDGEVDKARIKQVAEAEEVMAYFTSVMRGDIEMSDRERNKAAEILAKRYGLLDDRAQATADISVTIIDDMG